jgi:uncharacterized protein (DUF2141 family)
MKPILILCFLVTTQPVRSQTATLAVTVSNLQKPSGMVVISLYNEEQAFPIEGKEFRILTVPVKTLSVSGTFENLPRGEYAVAIFHDENADGICNLGLFGVPKEGFGFSRNFKPVLQAPKFKDCKILVKDNMKIGIVLIFR